METRIQKTLRQWFPDAFAGGGVEDERSDYEILRQFAAYTQALVETDADTKKEPFKIIYLLYSKGSLFERNAIENEFLGLLSRQEKAHTIQQNLQMMPEPLRPVYLKTILEN